MKYTKIIYFTLLLGFYLTCSFVILSKCFDEKNVKAGILVDNNHFKEALFLYNQILKNNPEITNYELSRLLNNIGFCYYKLNDFKNALIFYKKALEIDNSYVLCLNNISSILMNQKEYNQASLYLTKAYQLDSTNIKVIFNLFVVNYFLNKKEDSLYYLKEAFNIDEDYTTKRLGKNNIKTADIEKLRKHLKNYK